MRATLPTRSRPLLLSACIAALAAGALAAPAGAITVHPDYVPGAVVVAPASDVAYAGTSIFVGQGSFGAGTESIARIDANGAVTTVVSGLNSIGGLAYDPAGDRLLFTDNGLDAPGSPPTGDTLYELAAPLAATAAVPAAGLELLPAGSIPFAQAVLPLVGGDVLVGDAAGFGAGRVVRISGGTATDLVTGLDFTAGVALAQAGGELLVGQVDSGTFAGEILRFDLSGSPLGTLATGLSGAFDQAADGAGRLLVSGGFTPDFSSSTIVRIETDGAAAEVASGFTFSSGVDLDGPSGQLAVVDFGADRIHTLTPVERLTPGGRGKRDCAVELWGQAPDLSAKGKARKRWTCTDGDVSCDRDATADGACTFLVGACLAVSDPRLASCAPPAVETVAAARRPKVGGSTAFPDLQAAIDEVLPASAPVCSRGAELVVPAGRRVRVKLHARDAAGRTLDRDAVAIRCLP